MAKRKCKAKKKIKQPLVDFNFWVDTDFKVGEEYGVRSDIGKYVSVGVDVIPRFNVYFYKDKYTTLWNFVVGFLFWELHFEYEKYVG